MNFVNPFDLSRLFKNKGDQSLARIADINTVKEYVDSKDEWQETIVDISSAQILAMHTTPIELLPNLDSTEEFYEIDSLIMYYTYNTTEYNVGDFQFTATSNSKDLFRFTRTLLAGNENKVSIAKTQGLTWSQADSQDEIRYDSFTPSSNNGLTFKPGGAVTGGDGTLRAIIRYKIRTFGE